MIDRLKRIKNQADIVLNSRFLKNLSPLERYEFLQLCHRRTYNEGEFIFYRNDPGTGMYFIEEGKIELTIDTGEESETYRPGLLLDPPDSFGALSIGYDLRRKSSARCVSDCKLLGFFKPDFEILRDRHPQIAVKFLQTLSNIALRQLEKTIKRLTDLTDQQTALTIQFDSYYSETEEE